MLARACFGKPVQQNHNRVKTIRTEKRVLAEKNWEINGSRKTFGRSKRVDYKW